MQKAHVEIRKVSGIPRLFIDGRPLTSVAFRCRQHDFFDYMKRFAETGTELFFMTYLRNWNESWDEHFREVARRLDGILDLGDGICVVLGIYLSTSREWAERHPEELCWVDGKPVEDGTRGYLDLEYLTTPYSLCSEAFDEAAREHIDRSLDFLESYARSRRVIGIFLEGGVAQEWIPFGFSYATRMSATDTSPAALRAFRRFVEEKYGTEDALREAWGEPGASFSDLRPPTEEEAWHPPRGDYFLPGLRGQRVVDWRLATNECVARRMLNAAAAVKERRGDLLTGFFHEPIFPEADVYPAQTVLESPYMDFAAGPPQITCRSPGQHAPLMHMVGSVHRYGKLFFSETDIRTYDLPPQGLEWKGARTLDDSLALYEKALGLVLAKGTMAWYWQYQSKWFGEEDRYFEMNRNVNDIARLCFEEDCRSVSQVLAIVDESSAVHMRAGSRVVKNQVERTLTYEMGHIGCPIDVMLPSALEHPETDLSQYRLVFLLNNHLATREQRRAFELLKGGGRTIVFGHGSGYLSDDPERPAGIENMRELTGFEFEELDILWAPTITVPDEVEPLRGLVPLGLTFGQCYRSLRWLPDGKGRPLFPPVTKVSPVFAVSDLDVADLGYYNLEMDAGFHPSARTEGAVPFEFPGDTKYYCGMAMKEHEDWRAVYVGATLLPSVLLRAFCKLAGVHLYLDSEDIVYANDKLLVLHTNDEGGKRVVRFPRRCNVYDLKSEGWEEIAHGADALEIQCEPRRTWLLWMDDRPPRGGRL